MVLQGGTAVVNVVANGAALASSISGAVTSATQRVGRSMQATGLAMTKFLTVPLVALGAVSTKMALDFNTTFSKIEALAGDIGMTTEEAKQSVLDLAHATGQDPGGLADALYFAASAGLDAEKVFPVLRASARAAATGMGDASQTARTLTTVLLDYEGTGLSAANAMNILTEAIKVGKAEPEDFAKNIGIAVPIASQLGVAFEDVAAAIAQASNATGDVARSTTGLRFLLAALQNPTEEAKSAFEDYGISIQDVQQRLTESGGLLSVMQDINTTFDTTTVAGKAAWATVTGGARGAVIANTLVGNSAEAAREVFEALGISAKDTATQFQDAFAIMKQTPQFKFQQALTDLKEVAIELGNILIPILIKDVIPAIQDAVEWFQNLGDGTKKLIVQIGLFAAAFGPLLVVFGSVIRLGGRLLSTVLNVTKTVTGLGTAGAGGGGLLSFLATPAGLGIAGTIAGIGGAALLAADNTRDFNNEVKKLVESFHTVPGAIDEAESKVKEFADARAEALQDPQGRLSVGFAQARGFEGSREVQAAREALVQYREEMTKLVNAQHISDASTLGWLTTLAKSETLTKGQVKNLAAVVGGYDRLGVKLTENDRFMVNNLIKAGDVSGAMKLLRTRLVELTTPKWMLKLDSEADTSGVAKMVANMVGAGFHKAGSDWVAHGMVVIGSRPGSPWPWDRVKDGMTEAGFTQKREGGGGQAAWFMKTIVEVHADFTQVQAKLETLLPLIREAAGEGAADQARAFARDLKGLEKQFDRLKTKALDFRDAIKGAFTDAADLIGTIGDALSQFASDQAQFLEESRAFSEGGGVGEAPVAPTAPDLSALIRAQVGQAQQLANLLKQLQGEGLNVANLTDIAAQGAAGIPIAQALLQDPALIQQLNSAQQQIAEITQQTADKMTQAAFGDKLATMATQVEKLIVRLGEFVDALKPQKVSDKNREFVDALDALIRAINKATGNIGDGDGGGGGNANVTVNVGPGGDGAAAGRAVRDALVQLKRRNGSTGL